MLSDFYPSSVFKFCPFCGATEFVWDGVKAHSCGACRHKLYANEAAATVALIVNEQGELLFVRRKYDPAKGTLDLPGGFVDLGETAEHAIIREVKEELNLEVKELQFFGSFPNRYLFGGVVYFTLDLVFTCTVHDLSPLCAADDAEACMFIAPQKINVEEIGLESIREVAKRYRAAVIGH
ncbi:MAG: NUDIX domain-containing protein [Prevotellaceae bacterium]|jgi:ADP-ribose pyrophosphatase YjhB (NUDIX family)|nr:NUDIX domain-containing protein [Prevotellaceae bacterium]